MLDGERLVRKTASVAAGRRGAGQVRFRLRGGLSRGDEETVQATVQARVQARRARHRTNKTIGAYVLSSGLTPHKRVRSAAQARWEGGAVGAAALGGPQGSHEHEPAPAIASCGY
jgi:hypothetical protein